jgi:hypothetical protein
MARSFGISFVDLRLSTFVYTIVLPRGGSGDHTGTHDAVSRIP